MPMVRVAADLAGYPLIDPGSIKRRGIEAHRFGIGQYAGQRIRIVGAQLAKSQPGCLKNLHRVKSQAVVSFVILKCPWWLKVLKSTTAPARFYAPRSPTIICPMPAAKDVDK